MKNNVEIGDKYGVLTIISESGMYISGPFITDQNKFYFNNRISLFQIILSVL